MKKLITVILFLFSSSVFAASNSNPGLYYGQVPTAAQWNSYFSSKLDYAAGSPNAIPYWDNSGNFLSAVVSGDCTAISNVFTCSLTNSAATLFAAPPPTGSGTPNTGAFTTLTASNTLSLATGTTTVSPLKFTLGVNNTTPTAGVAEYDGTVQYFTPVASNRGVLLTEHFVNNSAAQTGTNVATAQPWFVTTLANGQITLPSTTTYEFEGLLALSTTGATSHSLAIGFGGTATLTSIGYAVTVAENATSLATITPVSRFNSFLNVATSTVITSAVATATYDTVEVRGTVRVNAGGTFIPQFTYSAAPGTAPTIAIGTYFKMRALGSNTITNQGNWN